MAKDAIAAEALSMFQLIHDGETIFAYIMRAIKANFHASIREYQGVVEVSLNLPLVFRPAAFSEVAVLDFYEAYGCIDRNTDATRYAKVLNHLWRARNPDHLPNNAKPAKVVQAVLDNAPQRREPKLPKRVQQLTALLMAAKVRDLQVARLCDALRNGAIEARGFLANDLPMRLVPIPTARWKDRSMECAWREAALRPRRGAPAATPHCRGLVLVSATLIAPAGVQPILPSRKGNGQEQMLLALQDLLKQEMYFKSGKAAHVAVLGFLHEDGIRRGYTIKNFYEIWKSRA